MSTSGKGIGIAAVIIAVCCAVLPLAGGALAGGPAFGAGSTRSGSSRELGPAHAP